MGIMIVLANVRDRLTRDRGAGLVEYVFLLALIAIVALITVEAFGSGVSARFSSINSSVN